MADYPLALATPLRNLSTFGPMCMIGDYAQVTGLAGGLATWPAANRALYVPVLVDRTVTVYQMGFEVGTQSGNFDIGIYDTGLNRLVSAGSTAVPVAGFAAVNIADTVLTPGVYFLAMNVDNITATISKGNAAIVACQIGGIQQQAVGAVTLPNPCTFTNPATAYAPYIVASVVATV